MTLNPEKYKPKHNVTHVEIDLYCCYCLKWFTARIYPEDKWISCPACTNGFNPRGIFADFVLLADGDMTEPELREKWSRKLNKHKNPIFVVKC